ncbi:MAG: NADAR family protein [Edafosvirus sp.]|uniref:NADAR family protein n=1 Tax=Edafosvirus sp. TaxID=2487765 RepID=A0A3G4ZVC0_9VIRU|nr:MAG: NADAR family protein [Edafosvirus sp.]
MTTIYFYGHNVNISDKLKTYVLSQWFPCEFKENENTYCSAEQYMMAHKALLFAKDDNKKANTDIFNKIMKSDNQAVIKKLGRMVEGFDQDVWEKKRFDIVVNGNMLKFSQNMDLKQILLGTGSAILAEASPMDKIWGIGMNKQTAITGAKWKGLNLLGKALMEVRSKLT